MIDIHTLDRGVAHFNGRIADVVDITLLSLFSLFLFLSQRNTNTL